MKTITFGIKSINQELVTHPEPMIILVTGGCGFIGSNFVNYAITKRPNWIIVNLDAMYYCANHKFIKQEVKNSNRYTFYKGNICDSDLVYNILDKHHITHVIHFAAQSHVQNSFKDASMFVTDNVLGTQQLLESIRKYNKIKKFIHVSTDEVYGDSSESKKTELSPLFPTNPYAASKAGAELMAQAYYHSYNIPIVITRGNNVYGPNQHIEKLIPCFIHKAKNNEKLKIQGTGLVRRSFMHISDAINAFECVLFDGIPGEIYNIGCEEGMEYNILDVGQLILDMIKTEYTFKNEIEFIEDRPYNDRRYYISNLKLKNIGWKQKVTFKQGLFDLINN
jgi:UDP-glucose 4,6-dehydratase